MTEYILFYHDYNNKAIQPQRGTANRIELNCVVFVLIPTIAAKFNQCIIRTVHHQAICNSK